MNLICALIAKTITYTLVLGTATLLGLLGWTAIDAAQIYLAAG